MPKVEVSCAISNCSYYGEGNICTAEKIMVEHQNHSRYDTELSTEFFAKNHTDEATMSAETCCKTFKPK
ncbi:DUF1540 domain-containing protein [Schinkia azotoformans]|uniref:DUF1540 domain-containing protein n=1 Tax=Schinkia azotoformans TaxID=1454 RepID=UPI002DBCE676|nr:DUF1540 domain-containing protein [Schinkia azotoformans]MEC1722692.1 DUF1540 domain-containing protein [Schinkia azotoformans]MED4413042.1 DUF1540 domain-containing protein [Schinkia azotoformans]